MTTQPLTLTACTLALLLAVGLPGCAANQTQARNTAAASVPATGLPLTAAQRQSFVGSYAITLPFGEPTSFRIFEENGVLKGQPEDQEARRLLYQGDNVFRPEGEPDFILTFVVEGGRATKFTGRRQDGVIEGIRVP